MLQEIRAKTVVLGGNEGASVVIQQPLTNYNIHRSMDTLYAFVCDVGNVPIFALIASYLPPYIVAEIITKMKNTNPNVGIEFSAQLNILTFSKARDRYLNNKKYTN